MPAYPNDGFVSCPRCNSMFTYEGEKPNNEKVEEKCKQHGRKDYTLEQRIAYALWYKRKAGDE